MRNGLQRGFFESGCGSHEVSGRWKGIDTSSFWGTFHVWPWVRERSSKVIPGQLVVGAQEDFPPRKDYPLPHPKRRHMLPLWSWAGWRGEINFAISPTLKRGIRYTKFKPLATITHIIIEDGTQSLSDRLFNSSTETAQEGPVAFTIRARILRSDSFSITRTVSELGSIPSAIS
jgi:hypothetical protein